MSTVADDLTADMLNEAGNKGMKISQEAAEQIAQTVPQSTSVANAPEPTLAEEVVEELREEAEEKFVLPTFAPVPDDEFAGFEEEEAEQTLEKLSTLLNADEEGYTDIEDADELRREVHKLRKSLDYQKELRSKSERARWVAEAKEKYPLANVNEITATSRNGFLKAAGKSHNANYEHLKPHLDSFEEARKKLVEEAKAEGRALATEAWGEPTTVPTVGDIDQSSYEAGLAEVRKSRKLEDVIRFMREHGRAPKV